MKTCLARAFLYTVLCALLLAGCGPSREVGGLPNGGVDAKVGDIYISDAFVEGHDGIAAHASAALRLVLTNDSDTPDALVGVSTPIAADVQLRQGGRTVSRIDIPAGAQKDFEWETNVELENICQSVAAGQSFPVTFRFSHAGAVTVQVIAGPLGPVSTQGGPQ